ncbi:MAG: glycosyltransferase family 4 protein [Rhodospirillales bacterium]|nr:glycosyltransferase family 4 protein [Rhodospirillales bacterium]
MTIALAIQTWFPHGGAQRDCAAIAAGLARLGHDVTVLTRRWAGPRPPGIAVEELPVSGLTNHAKAWAFAEAVAAKRAAESYDFVLGFDRMPGLDAYFAADRCLAERVAQRSPLAKLLPRVRAGLAMERAVYGTESPTRVILIAPDERAAIQRHYATPDSRFHQVSPILPEAAPGPPWTPAHRRSVREQLGFRADTLAVLLVAASLRTKGADRALQAIDRLPPALRARTMLIVAGAADAGWLRRTRGAERAVFLGPRDDLPDLMRACDLLIHPARVEMAGKVLVEAIQQGLPILCSAVAGYAPEVERAGAGRVLPEPFDQRALDAALAEMLDALPTAPWSRNALAYAASAPGFGQGIAESVALVDRWAREVPSS